MDKLENTASDWNKISDLVKKKVVIKGFAWWIGLKS